MPILRRPPARRVGLAAAIAAAPVALAWRFALVYRVRAGYPQRHPPQFTPGDVGLAWEDVRVPRADGAEGADLPGWFIPAGPVPGPGVAIIHGWESARDRMLPHAQVLHAAGFHVLLVDVRGHGANETEPLPLSAGEFGADAMAAFRALVARPEVTRGALFGHSLGGVGAILAAARLGSEVAALVAVAAPADPYRLTRQTFRLARLPIPDVIAWPLAYLTTRVYLRPRGHTVEQIDASRAIAGYQGPVLLIHGTDDAVVPAPHRLRLEAAARSGRWGRTAAPVATLDIAGGVHSWLYEHERFRMAVATFLAEHLGGPLEPAEAGRRAAATPAARLLETPTLADTLARQSGGLRSLRGLARRSPALTSTAPGPEPEPRTARVLETR